MKSNHFLRNTTFRIELREAKTNGHFESAKENCIYFVSLGKSMVCINQKTRFGHAHRYKITSNLDDEAHNRAADGKHG